MDNSTTRREFSFLDLLNIASFLLAIENLNANLNQNDKVDLQKDLNEKTNNIAKEIHAHLEKQDNKINRIIKILEDLNSDK